MTFIKTTMLIAALISIPAMVLADSKKPQSYNTATFGGGAFATTTSEGVAATGGSTQNGGGYSEVRNTSGATQFSGIQLGSSETSTGKPGSGNYSLTNTLTADATSFGSNYSTTRVIQRGNSTAGWGAGASTYLGGAAGWSSFAGKK